MMVKQSKKPVTLPKGRGKIRGGYVGKILRVDLTKGSITTEDLPKEKILRQYVGATGLAVKILSDELPVNVKPLDPENRVIFMTAPMTGTFYPCASDMAAVTLNANTGYTVGDSHTHGFLGAYLKFAGYDGMIVQGASKKPVYLWICDDQVEIRDAAEFWGKDTHETEDLIKAKVGVHDVCVAAIGPSGENLIHGAGIGNDKHHMFCKGGNGLVLGSKKLKAIAVKGNGTIPIAEPKKLIELVREWYRIAFQLGMAPLVYYNCHKLEGVSKGGGEEVFGLFAQWTTYKNMLSPVDGMPWAGRMYGSIHGSFNTRHVACWSCPVACCYRAEITSGPHKGYVLTPGGGAEGREGAAGIVGVTEPGTVFYLLDLNDRLGFDSAEPGVCLGLAFEMYERGLLTKEQTDGLELNWGNAEAAEALLMKITNREGFGKIFAEGVKKAAEILGGEASKYVIHVKGAGYNMHDWRTAWGVMLGQVTSGAGACWQGGFANDVFPQFDMGYHERSPRFTTEGLAAMTAKAQMKRVWDDCFGQCFLGGMDESDSKAAFLIPKAITAITGWEGFSRDETLTIGHRLITLERIFNMKRGLTIESDLDIGQRLLDAPTEGPAKGQTIAPHLRELIKEYYECMGWDRETGKPTPETLKKLDLTEAAKGL
jgi:aldehyde:ferredoxin oxidoreductase